MDKMMTRDWLRKLRPQVFEEAAKLISNKKHEHTYTCDALCWADATVGERLTYAQMFGPFDEYGDYDMQLQASHPYWDKPENTARQGMRQNALLFMAAMIRHARGEGRKR
jgi:hypothetical protein